MAGSAACGTVEQLSAGKKLDRAFEKLGKEKTLSFELDLDTDAASLKALDAKSEPEPGEELPDEAADLLSGAKISFTVESTKPIEKSGEKDYVGMAMKVTTPDGDLAEFRQVGDWGYIRTDPKALEKISGEPMPDSKELPPEAGAFKDVLEGKWVKFNTKEMEKAGGQGAGTPSPEPTLDAKTQEKLLDSLREVVSREVEFTTGKSEDGTEHITAVAPFRTLITELIGEIRPLAKDLPPGMELPTDKDLKDAPNAKVTADFALKNGELKEVRVDLAKLAEDAKVKKFGLVLRLGEGQKPTAPAGATELDLEGFLGGFAGPSMDEEGFDETATDPEGFPVEGFPEDAA
ncbi:hypothetical protein EIZ62_12220 [Streptomyces ficellus]|uniref:Uncharacterized protein n=1 Tax=Streptomyces ficellus TaxID=1977088 RepID=A0A6I6FWZ5_9ACTN|nr:hypothetical protein EIZ62_12220 [Streptomyces ficellus]